jgi:hypothetical protein
MRQIEIENLAPLTVVNGSPVLAGTLKPLNVIAPALAAFIINRMQFPSFAGAVMVKAPLLVMYCNGHLPQSTVTLPSGNVAEVTFAPPLMIWSDRSEQSRV